MELKVAVIGGGPAGYPAALRAARLGAQVTLIEKKYLGGVCLNCGCIPSKSLLDAAHRLDIAADIVRFCDGEMPAAHALSWPKIQARQQAVTQKLTGGIAALLKAAKVQMLAGEAEFTDGKNLLVRSANGEQTVAFDKVIIATGSQAFVPQPFDQIPDYIFDNSTIFQLPALPKTLAIIGGGAIGCEFATLMASFGVNVTLLEMQPRLLPNMDEGLSRVLSKNLQKRGVRLLLGGQVVSARAENGQAVLTLKDGTEISAEKVLAAIGRTCDLTQLHPERAGLTWNRKGLEKIDPHTLQITNDIYAAGDVTGLSLLAHAGTRQGIVAAQNACGQAAAYNNDFIPNAVYTTPELASVGLTKTQAEARGLSVKTYKSFMLANGRALTQDSLDGYVEIISNSADGKILGAVLACPNAADIISTISVALQAQMTVPQLKEVVFPHPTVCEAIGEALAK